MTSTRWWPCAAAALLALSAFAQSPADPARELRLRLVHGSFDPLDGVPPVPPLLRAADDVRLWVVQLHEAPTDLIRDRIRAAGGELCGYLPDLAFVVRMDAGAAVAVHRLGEVRWVGRYEPAWRLEPALVLEHVVGAPVPERRYNIVVVDKHRDKPALAAAVVKIGGRVVDEQPGSLLFTVDLDAAELLQVARLDQVLWIDRWSAPELDMNNARIQGGADYVEQAGGFRGQGVKGHVYEGVEASHPDFTNTPINVLSCGQPDTHGHCTGGIVFGNGTSAAQARGMAPDAQAYYTNFTCVNAGFSRWGVINDVVNVHECLFTTASWGNARTRSYTSISADADDIVFDHDIPWTQSQSNAGNQDSRPEAWAKNVFSIGAVQHFDDSNPANDSWAASNASIGPAADGRIKPDFCAYYDAIWCSDLTGSAGYSSGNSTTGFGGTSGATPIVAGHNAIALQMFTDGIFGNTLRVPGGTRFQNRPHFTTLKALMAAAAEQYPFTSSSIDNRREHQGWGFPNLRRMYDKRGAMFLVDETDVLTQGQSKTYTVRVAASEPDLRVVMSFSDVAGNPGAAIAAVNDLSLKVTDPNGTSYWGNWGLNGGNWSSTGGTENGIDTVECVFIQNPAAGDWTVEVKATLVAADTHVETPATDADFGLAVIGGTGTGGGGGEQCIAFHVPDNQPSQGSCNNVPFGTTRAAVNLANQRYQTIVRASELGSAPATFQGLAFAACGTGLRTHDTIRVQMSHVTPGHNLSATFANNLPSPVTVLQSRSYTWPSTANAWSEIGLQRPFSYDGTSDVVIDILLTGSDFAGAVPEFHRGTSPRVSALGWTGSPPATGTVATIGALKMRLQSKCASAVVLGLGCSSLAMDTGGSPQIGGSFDVILKNAAPSAPCALNFGFNNSGPLFPFDLTLLGVPGCWIYHDPLVSASLSTDPSGQAVLPLPVPNDPALAGGMFFVSGMQLHASYPAGAATSDYVRVVVGN